MSRKQDDWDFQFYGTARTTAIRMLFPNQEIQRIVNTKAKTISFLFPNLDCTAVWTDDANIEYKATKKGNTFSSNSLSEIADWINRTK